jgi:hypothetical protein
MRIGLIIFIFLSVKVYSQDFINIPEVDNAALIKEKNNLVKARVKQRTTYRQKGDTLGKFRDSHQSVMNISKNGRKIKERNYVIFTENSITTIFKKNEIKTISRELDCNDRPIGKKIVHTNNLRLKNDSLNLILSIWQDNKIKDTIIFYKNIEYTSSGKINRVFDYIVNKKLNCLTKKYVNPNDTTVVMEFNFYRDERGNIIRKEQIGYGKVFRIDFVYDNANNAIKRLEYMNNQLKRLITSEYNDLNLPVMVTTGLTGQNKIMKMNYKYVFYRN